MTARLTWGDVELMPEFADPDLPYRIEASGDGSTWGNPDAVVTAIQSRLRDGSLAVVDSFQNREAPIYLKVTADTYDGLAAGEEALVTETRRDGYNTLTWTPNEALAVPTVFDVVYGILAFDFDDLRELRLERYYVATLTCLPFPRSATEVIATALTSGSTGATSIDPATSGTPWTGQASRADTSVGASTTVTATGTAVRVGLTGEQAAQTLWLQRAGAVSTTGQPYTYIDWKWTGPGRVLLSGPKARVDGVEYPPIASIVSPTSGYTRTYFQLPSWTTSARFTINLSAAESNSGVNTTFEIDQLSKTDQLPSFGTGRQRIRSIAVDGSVRTQGRLSVQHESSALGEVLVYVFKDDSGGYIPALRPRLTSGGATTDTTLLSGARNNITSAQAAYLIPALATPRGTYRVMARIRGTAASVTATVQVLVRTQVGGVDLGPADTFTTNVTLTTAWTIVDLGSIALPTVALPTPQSGQVVVGISTTSATGGSVEMDEAWLFNMDIGALTHVDCGTGSPSVGGPSKRLWLDSAMVTNEGQDAIYRGHSADRSDAFNPPADSIKGWTPPQFEPPGMSVFTATTNAVDAAVELRHHPRFLHHAREVA